jgi:hypothetical protein
VSVDLNSFSKERRTLVLLVDLMHIMEISFLVTVIRDVRFIMVNVLPDRKRKTIMDAMSHTREEGIKWKRWSFQNTTTRYILF